MAFIWVRLIFLVIKIVCLSKADKWNNDPPMRRKLVRKTKSSGKISPFKEIDVWGNYRSGTNFPFKKTLCLGKLLKCNNFPYYRDTLSGKVTQVEHSYLKKSQLVCHTPKKWFCWTQLSFWPLNRCASVYVTLQITKTSKFFSDNEK